MDEKKKVIIVTVVVIVLIGIAAGVVGKTATAPGETINDFSAVPPKGAGKLDRD